MTSWSHEDPRGLVFTVTYDDGSEEDVILTRVLDNGSTGVIKKPTWWRRAYWAARRAVVVWWRR